ncbi:hypothetical protein FEP63_05172 [Burkholderia multivorans]|nr:hypothetical protein [Burkholderia multivorans]MDR8882447.1 hypothetical protein [Burkholderia multivorans]MDR8889492.1 hypothetical protein [Burkholderia multivorans]MDR8908246.1 hypothetical protein [Burkholderia multivorans]MDR8915256.1 hypothetical protein [Burkholderia multivorans]
MSRKALFRTCVFVAILMTVALVANAVAFLSGVRVQDQGVYVAGMVVLLVFSVSSARKYR